MSVVDRDGTTQRAVRHDQRDTVNLVVDDVVHVQHGLRISAGSGVVLDNKEFVVSALWILGQCDASTCCIRWYCSWIRS